MSTFPCKEIALDIIDDPYPVRTSQDHDRASEMAKLMVEGVKFPPPIVYQNGKRYTMCDGRTRCLAIEAITDPGKVPIIRCEVRPKAAAKNILAVAFNANYGGAAPVTMEDARHTIRRMIEEGASREFIISKLHYPKELTAKLINEAKSYMLRRRVTAAVETFKSNPKLSVEQVAKMHNITPKEFTRAALKKEVEDETLQKFMMGVNGNLEKVIRSFGQNMRQSLDKVMKGYESGLVSKAQVNSVLNHLGNAIDNFRLKHDDWVSRFENVDCKKGDKGGKE